MVEPDIAALPVALPSPRRLESSPPLAVSVSRRGIVTPVQLAAATPRVRGGLHLPESMAI